MNKVKKYDLERMDMRIVGYVLFLFGGIFVYLFSIGNIYFLYRNDVFRLVGQILLAGYFVLGMIVVHVTYRFFNKKIFSLAILGLACIWTVITAALFFIQLIDGAILLKWIYIALLTIQIGFFIAILIKNKSSLSVLKKILGLYMLTMCLSFSYVVWPAIRNGDYLWRWNGPDHVRWYEKKYGLEVADAITVLVPSAFVLAVFVGSFIWAVINMAKKMSFVGNDSFGADYVIFSPLKYKVRGMQGVFTYSSARNNHVPDQMSFFKQEGEKYFFKRSFFRGSTEELIFLKEEGMGEGIYSCEVKGSDKEPRHVMALYEEKPGQWRPFEFDEIEEVKEEGNNVK
ncbi:hypothetical protein NSQ26_04600 [Bacillus sp. FSL W7-1360]